MSISRRTWLITSAAAFFGVTDHAISALDNQDALANNQLMLTIPEVAENGYSVPISINVESPMSEEDFIESVMIIAHENPTPEVATFHFTHASGAAKASIRMRLAKTQEVVAIAKSNTGKLLRVSRQVKVVIGGCSV